MKPVYQSKFGAHGNCMQAAVASLLEFPLEVVPDFGDMPGDAFARMRKYFASFGLEFTDDKPPPDRYYFETGISTQGHEHIVLMCNGALAHDPNPTGGGLVKVNGVLYPHRSARLATDAKPPEEKPVTLRPIFPNAGIRAWYRKQLLALAERMAADIERKIAKFYRPASDRIAQDDDPIVLLRRVMRAWGRRWTRRFDEMSQDIADSFAGRTQRYTDVAIRKRMRDAGFTVKFRPTERQLSAYRAVVAENVNLIRSIPREFHKDVESAVWSAVTKGGALSELSTTIRKKYGVTYRRAALIARDQSAKAKATLEKTRRIDLGISEAIWVHSHAGREPRPLHLKWGNEQRRYKIADGIYDSDEGKNVQPGELINCKCTSRAVLPGRFARKA